MPNWIRGMTFDIDPDATMAYTFRWDGWLTHGYEIVAHEILTDGDIQIVSDSRQGSDVTIWVTGVSGRPSVTCRVTTDGAVPLTDDRTITFKSVQK